MTFSFKRTLYEMDLSKKNLNKMVKALKPYTSAARKVGGRRSATGRPTARRADRDQLAKIRERARANGPQVADRGRIGATQSKTPTTRPTRRPSPPHTTQPCSWSPSGGRHGFPACAPRSQRASVL